MFSRWLNVGMKAAEQALEAGRVDEAFARLSVPDVRRQRRAQELLDQVARVILARARIHAQAGRYREALLDLDRLAAVDRADADVLALRARVDAEMGHRVERQRGEADELADAAGRIDAGRLESGRLAVERVEDPAQREALRDKLNHRLERSAQLLTQARGRLAAGDVLGAWQIWDECLSRHGRTDDADVVGSDIAAALRRALDAWFTDGRLERFQSAADALASLRRAYPVLDEHARLMELVRATAALVPGADFTQLRDALLRLSAARPDAAWIREALKHVEQLAACRSSLIASPIGMLADFAPRRAEPVLRSEHADAHEPPPDRSPLLLLVDGTGSALICRRQVVRIGRGGATTNVDVPLPADIQSHHADIVQHGDDFFLVAHGPARVNQRAANKTLLRDGDRIVLGSGTKLVFLRPSAKSQTAVLRLADRCRLPQDVSLVVLFRDTCLIGPQESCHIRTREGEDRVVLFERDGRMHVRRSGGDGRPAGAARALPVGSSLEFGELRVTAKSYDPRDAHGLA